MHLWRSGVASSRGTLAFRVRVGMVAVLDYIWLHIVQESLRTDRLIISAFEVAEVSQ